MMTLRNAQESDIEAIVAIYNSTIALGYVTADTEPTTVAARTEWFHTHNAQRPLIIAEMEGKVAGFLSFKSFYGRPAYSITVEIGIYISPESRGKGLGKTLLNHAIFLAPKLGIENILGFVFEANTPSINLFKNEGFEAWGTLPNVAKQPTQYQTLIILGKNIK